MTLLLQIQTFLTNPADYAQGLHLLKQTGFSGFTLTVLEMGEDAYTRPRLIAELRHWYGDQPKHLPVFIPEVPTGSKDSSVKTPQPATATGVGVAELTGQTHRLMDERQEMKARIRAVMDEPTKQEDRRLWAYRIKAITRELDEIYSRLDFQKAHGYLPSAAPTTDSDETALLLNVRSYVSRYKAKLKKKNLSPEQRQQYQALLTQYEAEKTRLETNLSKHDSDPTRQQTTHCQPHSAPLSRP